MPSSCTRTSPSIIYVIGKEGGEIWSDFYAVPKGAPHRAAGYALINFLLTPENNKNEVLFHGYPVADKRVLDLLPPEMLKDTIMFPAAEELTPLEFGAAATLTNPAAGRDHGALQVGLTAACQRRQVRLTAAKKTKEAGRLTTALLLAPAAFWFLMLLILPLAVVIVYSFGERAATGGYQAGFTLANYLEPAGAADGLQNTLTLAPMGTLICLLIGYPLAYFLAVKIDGQEPAVPDHPGHRAVLDQLPDPHLCLDVHPGRARDSGPARLDRHSRISG